MQAVNAIIAAEFPIDAPSKADHEFSIALGTIRLWIIERTCDRASHVGTTDPSSFR